MPDVHSSHTSNRWTWGWWVVPAPQKPCASSTWLAYGLHPKRVEYRGGATCR
jgi:hypothetical protein